MPCHAVLTTLTLLGALPGTSGRFAKRWWCLGPFASGKAEYDGDPLVPLGGLRQVYLEGPGSNFKNGQRKFLAEHVTGGRLSWISTEGSNQDGWTHVQIPHAHVAFQNLMQQPPKGGNSDVLHVQYWMVGTFKIKDPGGYGINCRGLHTFHLLSPLEEEIGPFAGNIYSDGMLTSPVYLEAGKYRLMSRVRGKVPLHFSCKIEVVKEIFKSFVKKSNLPDVVQGQLLVDPAPLDVRVLNSGRDFLRVRAHVQGQGAGGVSATITLAPGVLAQLPLPLSLSPQADTDVERAACVRLEVVVEAYREAETLRSTNSVQLRCRRSDQSALFSYEDSDGSVGLAAVLPPRQPSSGARPVLVSLSGVGVEPQGQADAYKMKHREEEDYLFGFDDLWVLAPQRDGPHNWEDVGLRSALRAVEVLTGNVATSRAWREKGAADAERLVVHGHSRGGHGAWALATRIPDRVLGVASACGWYSREEYGDANNLWVHETSLMHMDKQLLGLLHASIAMNENSLHASNLKGMPALVRVASKDKAVPPWFGRRMARHLQEEGANVTFEEFDQEHWWWDTLSANDGGVVHDASIRQWTLDAAGRSAETLAEILQQGPFVVSAGGPQYLGRFGLRILQRRSRAARGFLQITLTNSSTSTTSRRLRLRSSNVQSFAVSATGQLAQLSKVEGHMHRLMVDSQVLDFEVKGETVHFCKGDAMEEPSCQAPSTGASLQWRRCMAATAAHAGPIGEVFAAPWMVVVPDDPTPLELRLGAYFATGHLVAVGSATQLRTSSTSTETSRRVLLGTVERLRTLQGADWPVELNAEGPPTITVAGCTFTGDGSGGYGAVFRAPGQELVITATDERALKDLVTFSFATNQPHTRAPMSNMLPDFLITGPEFAWKGYGGVVAAGFWDERWRAAPNSAYLQC